MAAEEAAFQSFLSEFRTLSSTLSSQLSHIPKDSTLSSQRSSLTEAEQTADDLTSLLSTIEPDLRHYPYSLRTKAQSQFEECQSQFDSQQSTLQRYQKSLNSGRLVPSSNPRADLLSGVPTPNGGNADQRGLLLSSRAVLQEGDSSLDNTKRMLAEAAAVGVATSTQLVEQREQFGAQIEDLGEAEYSLTRSRRTLRSMALRVITNKLMSAGIVLTLILLFILIAWLKYWKMQ